MPFDWITEAISRFIGALEITTEAARPRHSYEPFRNTTPETSPEPEADPGVLRLIAPHQLNGFTPWIALTLLPPGLDGLAHGWHGPNFWLPVTGAKILRFSEPDAPHHMGQGRAAPQINWLVPYPPQLASYTEQHIRLIDADDLSWGDGSSWLSNLFAQATLTGLEQQAMALSLPALAGLSQLEGIGSVLLSPEHSLGWLQALAPMAEAVADDGAVIFRHYFVPPPEPEPVDSTLPDSGPAAAPDPQAPLIHSVIMVNGVAAESLPDLHALVSQDWQDALGWKDDEDDDSAEDGSGEGEDIDPWGGLGAPAAAPPPGHHLTTGGNLLSNEVVIASNGPDAGVLVVAGDHLRLDLISQVAVLVGGDALAFPAGYAADQLFNAAELHRGYLALTEQDQTEAAGATAALGMLPQHWSLTRMEGDLVFVNQIEQHIFANDFDRIEAVLTAQTSQISLGGNLLSNVTTIAALSSHYDMIIIGGSMVTMNLIEQIAVLYDSDRLEGWQSAELSGGGNLVFNSARILHDSLDRAVEMNDDLRHDLPGLAEGHRLSAEAMHDPVFAGSSALSILYVTGDFIEQNIIRQVSHLGDADQVVDLQDRLGQSLPDAVITVETGGNLLVNAATILDQGRDSALLVAGQTYSDAVLYQAGLLDHAAPPDGVQLREMPVSHGDLTPAAVAFLTSDTADTGDGLGIDAHAAPDWAPLVPAAPDGVSALLS